MSMSSACDTFLSQLIGDWKGTGSAFFPTHKTVEFDAELSFSKPEEKTVQQFVMSTQRTKHATKGVGMHFDNGFLRCVNDGKTLEWLLTHNSGNVEVVRGDVQPGASSVTLESVHIGGAPETLRTKRIIELPPSSTGGTSKKKMVQKFGMATLTLPKTVQDHLIINFERAP